MAKKLKDTCLELQNIDNSHLYTVFLTDKETNYTTCLIKCSFDDLYNNQEIMNLIESGIYRK